MIIKELFEGPVGDYCIARNTIKCLLYLLHHSQPLALNSNTENWFVKDCH